METKIMILIIAIGFVQGRIICPENKCPPDSQACPYQSYFGNSMVGICRGCNYCVQAGTPKDSRGCPVLPCPNPVPSDDCKNPLFFSRWILYNGLKCPACQAFTCNPAV